MQVTQPRCVSDSRILGVLDYPYPEDFPEMFSSPSSRLRTLFRIIEKAGGNFNRMSWACAVPCRDSVKLNLQFSDTVCCSSYIPGLIDSMPGIVSIVTFGSLALRSVTNNPLASTDTHRGKDIHLVTPGGRDIRVFPTYTPQSLTDSGCGACGSGDIRKTLMIKDLRNAWAFSIEEKTDDR